MTLPSSAFSKNVVGAIRTNGDPSTNRQSRPSAIPDAARSTRSVCSASGMVVMLRLKRVGVQGGEVAVFLRNAFEAAHSSTGLTTSMNSVRGETMFTAMYSATLTLGMKRAPIAVAATTT